VVARALRMDPDQVLSELSDRSHGFVYIKRKADPARAAILKKAGILDSAKVACTALANAASVAAELVTAEALVSEVPDEQAEKAMGAAGAPMM